ncbi:MAG: MBL fold metallo-hydrolase [Elusimicrobia bacterium]|nr:MBL fold metallo-hydrolase [Elusimicrobiota bacterium]
MAKGRRYIRSKLITGMVAAVTLYMMFFIVTDKRFESARSSVFSKKKMGAPVLKVTFLYVGQGDAALVRDLRPGGKTMLIDAGPSPEVEEFMTNARSDENYAAGVIIPYLKRQGVKKIDYAVMSHKDGDHIGGYAYLIRNFPVGTIYDNGIEGSSPYVKQINKALRETPSVKYEVARAGRKIGFDDGITCQFIAPMRDYGEAKNPDNNASIVVRVVAGNISFLFTGDIEIPAELDLMRYGKDLEVTVIKVPHHGSTSSSSTPFLDMIKPDAAVFSCGRYNKLGFPTFDIIRRYEDRGAGIYRTDMQGNIEMLTDGRTYKVLTER